MQMTVGRGTGSFPQPEPEVQQYRGALSSCWPQYFLTVAVKTLAYPRPTFERFVVLRVASAELSTCVVYKDINMFGGGVGNRERARE